MKFHSVHTSNEKHIPFILFTSNHALPFAEIVVNLLGTFWRSENSHVCLESLGIFWDVGHFCKHLRWLELETQKHDLMQREAGLGCVTVKWHCHITSKCVTMVMCTDCGTSTVHSAQNSAVHRWKCYTFKLGGAGVWKHCISIKSPGSSKFKALSHSF